MPVINVAAVSTRAGNVHRAPALARLASSRSRRCNSSSGNIFSRQAAWRRPAGAASRAASASVPAEQHAAEVPRLDAALDDELSRRPLSLDEAGFFIIAVDAEVGELVADYYTNVINAQGLACDPATGEVISCKLGAVRLPTHTWRGRTAKALSVAILEADHGFQPVTLLEHANYLGRELQRAEFALLAGQRYMQD